MKNILASKNYGWRNISRSGSILWIKGIIHNHSDENIFLKLISIDNTEIKNFLKKIDGHFAFIFEKKDKTIFAVDEIASIPLLYSRKDKIVIGSEFDQINNLEMIKFNKDSVLSIAMSGYTIGDKTIYEDLNIVSAGHFAILNLNSNKFEIKPYHCFSPWNCNLNIDYTSARKELIDLNFKIIKKTYDYSIKHNKKIAVPLSAGYDSRLIVSTLKQLGAKNVITFSYGLKNNFEAVAAKKISNYLGYDWYFVNLNHKKVYRDYQSQNFTKYLNVNNNYFSVLDYKEFTPIKELTNSGLLDNSIIVNGQAGDYISGGHTLHKNFQNNKRIYTNNKENVFKCIIDKHFSLWSSLKTKENIKKIEDILKIELKKNNLDNDYYFQDNLNYIIIEFLEYYNRQSKHVVSRQRVYEFFKHEWSLPLWDKEYINFWEKIPIQFKVNQSLYIDALIHGNSGNVWSKKWMSLKTNLKISPNYFRFFIRPFFKIFFFFLSKKKWHDFEKKFIYYWIDNVCGMGIKKYMDILIEKRGFRNSFSFSVADYLHSKTIDFDKNIKFKNDKNN